MAVVLAVVTLTSCDSHRIVTGWLPYWIPSTSSATFVEGADYFEELSPFQYAARRTPSTIEPLARADTFDSVIAAARERGVPVLPTIVDEFPARGMAAVLADPESRREHIDAIVGLVMSKGYDGIDLDYERFAFSDGSSTWSRLKPNWIAFVTELGDELHRRGRLLSVTVPAIWIDQWGNLRGYWSYAWAEIAPSIDRLRVMVYDWSYSEPGPIAPIWWVRQVLAYADSTVPMSKVQLGIPAYGREWTADTEGTCPASVVPSTRSHTMRQIPGLLADTGARPSRDASSGEMTFTYEQVVLVDPDTTTTTTSPSSTVPAATSIDGPARGSRPATRLDQCVITREVWYPDATSWRTSTRAALDAGATGVAVWALGYETPDAARAIGEVSSTVVGPTGTAPVGRLGRLRVSDDGRLRVIGWAFDPEGDLPINVRVTVTSLDDPAAAPVERTLLARQPKPKLLTSHPGAGEFHGFRTVVRPRTATGRQRVCVDAIGRYDGPNDVAIGCRTITLP